MLDSAERFEERWRRENEDNYRYYDGDQWTESERYQLAQRGQPPVVVNLVGAMIDMVRSLEVQQRVDIQIVGREQSDDATASLLTALLKQVFDRAHFDYFLSKAFTDALIGGRGWIECSVRPDRRGKDQIEVEHVPWEEVYIDPNSRLPDGSDARFIIRVKWLDKDVAKRLFPDAAELLETRFNEGDDSFKGHEWEAQRTAPDRGLGRYYDYASQRVKVCQCWYTRPEYKTVKSLDERTGRERERRVFVKSVHHVIFSDDLILEGSAEDDSRNPNSVDIDEYPLVPLLCSTDRHGHPVGMVKNMIGLQDELNKLNSKMIHKFGTRQVTVEKSAVRDPEEFRLEMQRPDGLGIVEDGGLSKVKIDYNTEDMGFITNQMQFVLQMLQRETGVNDSTLGLGGPNERSGTIQSARIAQGASLHTPKLENLHFCRQRVANVVLRLMGAYYTDYRVLRVTQPNGLVESYQFNVPEVDPQTGEPTGGLLHRIDDTLDYDVIMKRVPPFTSIRERQLTIFSEVLKAGVLPPELSAQVLLELSDIPNKEEILRKSQMMMQQQQDMASQQQALDMAQQEQQMALDAAAAQQG